MFINLKNKFIEGALMWSFVVSPSKIPISCSFVYFWQVYYSRVPVDLHDHHTSCLLVACQLNNILPCHENHTDAHHNTLRIPTHRNAPVAESQSDTCVYYSFGTHLAIWLPGNRQSTHSVSVAFLHREYTARCFHLRLLRSAKRWGAKRVEFQLEI